MEFIKKFTEWVGLKEKIDTTERPVLHFSEREVWMCHFGENIGFESSGKNENFHRPVVILHKFGAYTFYAIPMSTKIKNNQYYIEIEFNKKKQSVMISQMRILDVRRLHYRKGRLSIADFNLIKTKFLNIFQKNNPSNEGSA